MQSAAPPSVYRGVLFPPGQPEPQICSWGGARASVPPNPGSSARWVIVMVIIPVTGLCSVACSGEPKRRVLNRNGSDPTVARPSVWRGNADLSNPTLGTAVPRWFPGTNRLSV